MKRKVIIGVTGASGSVYAQRLLKKLETLDSEIIDCGVVFTKSAETVVEYELNLKKVQLTNFPVYENDNYFAPFASGSANYDTMIICPCTMGTLGRIAHGYANDLLSRAADVILKEGKKLLIVPREMPYNLIHLENMKLLVASGAIICPASPSFYSKPNNMEELVDSVINKVLNLAGFPVKTFEWGGQEND